MSYSNGPSLEDRKSFIWFSLFIILFIFLIALLGDLSQMEAKKLREENKQLKRDLGMDVK